MSAGKAIGFAALAAGVLALLGSGEDEEAPETGEDEESDDSVTAPRVGFRAPVELVNITNYEDESPRCGYFYQVQRGDIWLGIGPKSISWQALFRIGVDAGLNDSDARDIAKSVALRVSMTNLIIASAWNDSLYSTWGYGPKDFVGEQGRALPLAAVHADNRELMLAQHSPERMIDRGEASWKGTSRCVGVTGASRPYLWIPLIDAEKAVDGIATTEGLVWPGDGRVSVLEPPAEIWAIGGIV